MIVLRCPVCNGQIDHLTFVGGCPLCPARLSAIYLAIVGDVWVGHSGDPAWRARFVRRSIGSAANVVLVYQLEWRG